MTIAEAITRNPDTDILAEFDRLPSVSTKWSAVVQLLEVLEQERSALTEHRCLLSLACLLEQMTGSRAAAEEPSLQPLIQRIRKSRLSRVLPRAPAVSTTDLAQGLCSNLRAAARERLKDAVSSRIPQLCIDLALKGTWSRQKTQIRIQLPVRLDLGMGGISDIPPCCMERSGNCVGMPILIDGAPPVEAMVEVLPQQHLELVSKDHRCKQTVSDLSNPAAGEAYLSIHRGVLAFVNDQVLKHKSLGDLYEVLHGGLRLTTFSRLPVGTGLGVSSLLPCALLKALADLLEINLTNEAIAAASVFLENVIGTGGGWEDSTAIHPGVKMAFSSPAAPFVPEIRPVSVKSATLARLQHRLLLLHTGVPKCGQAFFEGMIERYCLGESATIQAVKKNYALNEELLRCLEEGDLGAVGAVMEAQWNNWKSLTRNKCTAPIIETLFAEAAPYVEGARLNGAGGGGCAMLLAREGREERLRAVVRSVLSDQARFYDWKPEPHGSAASPGGSL